MQLLIRYKAIFSATIAGVTILGNYVFDQRTTAKLDDLPTTKFVRISYGNFLAAGIIPPIFRNYILFVFYLNNVSTIAFLRLFPKNDF